MDIIIDREGKHHLNEINGITSGMHGFAEIYGDNRVNEQVFQMLQDRYGTITANDGTYRFLKYTKEHPYRYRWSKIKDKIPLVRNLGFSRYHMLLSEKADIVWLEDDLDNAKALEYPFDSYVGQDSTVMNYVNEVLPHPTVNSFVAEALTHNKFLQYISLEQLRPELIPTTIVGMGITDEKTLSAMLDEHDCFVVKPILGQCGKGVRFMNKDTLSDAYSGSRGPTKSMHWTDAFGKKDPVYIEDLIEQRNFVFELGISVVQPFIDSGTDDTYTTLRAIVCNGKFVDAYERVSDIPRVNLSQGASARAFEHDKDFAAYCEEVVCDLEAVSATFEPEDFRYRLYTAFLDKRGRTSDHERTFDKHSALLGMLRKVEISRL